jgi:hypothetical protein
MSPRIEDLEARMEEVAAAYEAELDRRWQAKVVEAGKVCGGGLCVLTPLLIEGHVS